MEEYFIEPTKYTPLISYDSESNTLEIKGMSYPPDITEFYDPFFIWLNQYLEQRLDTFTLNIELTYLNSSSSRMLWKLFDRLEEDARNGGRIIINWIYDEEDDDKFEMGDEFRDDLESVTFNLTPKKI